MPSDTENEAEVDEQAVKIKGHEDEVDEQGRKYAPLEDEPAENPTRQTARTTRERSTSR